MGVIMISNDGMVSASQRQKGWRSLRRRKYKSHNISTNKSK